MKTSTVASRFQEIPAETIEAIRDLSPIEHVVSEQMQLRRSGTQLLGRCPFHADKTPSFSVNPAKKVFYCHGCGAGGDVFSFVGRLYRLDFPAAVRWLGEKASISLDAPVPEAVRDRVLEMQSKREQAEEQERLIDAQQDAANLEYYKRAQLATKAENFLREHLFGSMRHTVAKDQIADMAWLVLAEYREIEAEFSGEREAFEEFEIDGA